MNPHGYFRNAEGCEISVNMGTNCGIYWSCTIETEPEKCAIREELRALDNKPMSDSEAADNGPYLKLLARYGYAFRGWKGVDFSPEMCQCTEFVEQEIVIITLQC